MVKVKKGEQAAPAGAAAHEAVPTYTQLVERGDFELEPDVMDESGSVAGPQPEPVPPKRRARAPSDEDGDGDPIEDEAGAGSDGDRGFIRTRGKKRAPSKGAKRGGAAKRGRGRAAAARDRGRAKAKAESETDEEVESEEGEGEREGAVAPPPRTRLPRAASQKKKAAAPAPPPPPPARRAPQGRALAARAAEEEAAEDREQDADFEPKEEVEEEEEEMRAVVPPSLPRARPQATHLTVSSGSDEEEDKEEEEERRRRKAAKIAAAKPAATASAQPVPRLSAKAREEKARMDATVEAVKASWEKKAAGARAVPPRFVVLESENQVVRAVGPPHAASVGLLELAKQMGGEKLSQTARAGAVRASKSRAPSVRQLTWPGGAGAGAGAPPITLSTFVSSLPEGVDGLLILSENDVRWLKDSATYVNEEAEGAGAGRPPLFGAGIRINFSERTVAPYALLLQDDNEGGGSTEAVFLRSASQAPGLQGGGGGGGRAAGRGSAPPVVQEAAVAKAGGTSQRVQFAEGSGERVYRFALSAVDTDSHTLLYTYAAAPPGAKGPRGLAPSSAVQLSTAIGSALQTVEDAVLGQVTTGVARPAAVKRTQVRGAKKKKAADVFAMDDDDEEVVEVPTPAPHAPLPPSRLAALSAFVHAPPPITSHEEAPWPPAPPPPKVEVRAPSRKAGTGAAAFDALLSAQGVRPALPQEAAAAPPLPAPAAAESYMEKKIRLRKAQTNAALAEDAKKKAADVAAYEAAQAARGEGETSRAGAGAGNAAAALPRAAAPPPSPPSAAAPAPRGVGGLPRDPFVRGLAAPPGVPVGRRVGERAMALEDPPSGEEESL
jgi:hypothetical protein